MNSIRGNIGLGALVGVLMASSAAGANVYWRSLAGGNFTNAANWNTVSVPGGADTVYFNSNATYNVKWTGGWTNTAFNFNAPAGQVTVDVPSGTRWRLTEASSIAGVAGASAGVAITSGTVRVERRLSFGEAGFRNSLTVSGGAVLEGTNDAYFARSSHSNRVTIAGQGSTLRVGYPGMSWGYTTGHSRMVVTNGGLLQLASFSENGFRNEILVTGTGSRLIGPDGSHASGRHNVYGTSNRLTVANGGLMMPRHNTSWASSALTYYTLLVTGEGSVYSNDAAFVGAGGNFYLSNATQCRMIASDGGKIRLGVPITIHSAAVTRTVTLKAEGAGSELSLGALYCSFSGAMGEPAGLVVTNQGLVAVGTLRLGAYSHDRGSAYVSGSGSRLTASASITLAQGGTNNAGYLTVCDGGSVETPTFYVAGDAATRLNTTGGVDVAGVGSVLKVSGTMTVGVAGQGEMTVTNAGTVRASALTMGSNATSLGNVVRVRGGHLQVTNAINVTRGTLAIQGSDGSLESGSMTLGADGFLSFTLDSQGVRKMVSRGAVTIHAASKLNVNMARYDRIHGLSVMLVDGASLAGSFAEESITLSGLNGGTIEQAGGDIILHVYPALGTVVTVF